LKSWDEYNRRLLQAAFTGQEEAQGYPKPFNSGNPSTFEITAEINNRVRYLQDLRDRIELYEEQPKGAPMQPEPANANTRSSIFIVHGHQEALKQEVARYLQAITNLKPAILHELPKSGRTIIEGLEHAAANSVFAVVLLTSDDEGGVRNSPERYMRARQNVVFELGLFIGLLGRSSVAVLYEQGVELPSDMNGVLYTALDNAGAWKLNLARELLAAGVSVDLNQAILKAQNGEDGCGHHTSSPAA
jgi:predicted nucleotide-binding protein